MFALSKGVLFASLDCPSEGTPFHTSGERIGLIIIILHLVTILMTIMFVIVFNKYLQVQYLLHLYL